ncbi:MAG: hypothetical protein JWM05_2969 [Acidimicrobiales bacterium]|nr:hypothetical protein [Acidimicrobiales bacterium]
MHEFYPSGNPRFNHVAMSVPADLLDEDGRRDIVQFMGDVLGFDELPTMTIDRQRLILSCVDWEQFIFLIADDDPLRCPRLDHFGFSVGTRTELEAARDRALAFRERDPRVDLIDISVDDQDVVKIHSMYVGYLLPMMCELQWWELPR